jgi:hypothetical protein
VADGAGELLTRKIGPAPAWVWAAGAAVAVWWVLRSRGTGATPRTNVAGASPAGQATTDYSLGYAQGLQSAAPAPAAGNQTSCVESDTQWRAQDWVTFPSTGAPGAAASYWYKPNGIPAPFVKNCVKYSWVPDPATATIVTAGGGQLYYFPSPGSPVLAPGNGTQLIGAMYSAQTLVQQQPGALPGQAGGPSPRKHAIGSRSAHEWHDTHPMVGARVLYPHYVRAIGGPARHLHEVHRVARQAGVHPARVLMLNPEPNGRIRIA